MNKPSAFPDDYYTPLATLPSLKNMYGSAALGAITGPASSAVASATSSARVIASGLTETPVVGKWLSAFAQSGPTEPVTQEFDPSQLTGLKYVGATFDADTISEYRKAASLGEGQGVPATYVFVMSFPLVMKLFTSPQFPMPVVGAVHLSNTIEFFTDLNVGDIVDIRVRAENFVSRSKGTCADVVTELVSAGQVVASQVSTFLFASKLNLPQPDGSTTRVESVVPAGESTHYGSIEVDQDIISRYGKVSGDINPIHMSAIAAKAFGFPTSIAHGMWTAAALTGTIQQPAGAFVHTVKFGKPVLLPATLDITHNQGSDGVVVTASHPEKQHVHATVTVASV